MANRLSLAFTSILTLVFIVQAISLNGTKFAAANLNQTNSEEHQLFTINSTQLDEYVNETIKLSHGTIVPKAIRRFRTKEGDYRMICKVVTDFVQLNDDYWKAFYARAKNIIIYSVDRTTAGERSQLCYMVDAVSLEEAECLLQLYRTEKAFPRAEKFLGPAVLLARSDIAGLGLTKHYCPTNLLRHFVFAMCAILVVLALLLSLYYCRQCGKKPTPNVAKYRKVATNEGQATELKTLAPAVEDTEKVEPSEGTTSTENA